MISMQDAQRCSEETLRRLLDWALERDAAGPRLRQTPPRDKKEVIIQLSWLGVIS